MTKVDLFSHIRVPLPFERVLRRLGYRSGTTTVQPGRLDQIRQAAEEAFTLLELQGVGRMTFLDHSKAGVIRLADGYEIESAGLSRFLQGSTRVLLMGATAGNAVMEAIRERTEKGRLDEAAVIDAAASEMVDDALDWIMDYYRNRLRPDSATVSRRRYSAGYGDFDLFHQAYFVRSLSLEKLGVSVTERFLLLPEKSVTALASVERIGYNREETV
ncbi:MAG TPA: hypothetical protein ENN69_07400 [Spirochaetia bacterium]|nr:hypothetical protein [Spirochaetia bacterium]